MQAAVLPARPVHLEASWTQTADHESYLFVPPRNATTGPAPHIFALCNPGNSRCAAAYPFACVNADITIGAEVTTIHQLLPGTYEYWVELDSEPNNPDGEVTVALKDKTGRVMRRWTRRADPTGISGLGWHVFDVDGRSGRVTGIDAVRTDAPLDLPTGAHDPTTSVCPFNA
ncbi:MAG: hypothetical protein ACRDJC_07800 [Thermomicrobiales bacterium]